MMIHYILFYIRTTSSWGPMIRRSCFGYSILEIFLFLIYLQNILSKKGQSYFLLEYGDTVCIVGQFILILLIGVIAILLYCSALDFVAYLRIIRLLGYPRGTILIGLVEGSFLVGIPALISATGFAALLARAIIFIFPEFDISGFLITAFFICVVTLCLTLVLCVSMLLLKDR